jgi:hypothetical protein
MPRIRLRIEEEVTATPYLYRDPDSLTAGVLRFPVLRLATLARIEPRPGNTSTPYNPIPALIDTGAWITVIETQTWRDFETVGLLEHVPFVGATTRSAAVGGRSSDYTLGRIWVSLLDLQPPRRPSGTPPVIELPAVPVITQLLLNPRCRLPCPLVLGLHLGVLDSRRLTREVVPPRPSPLPTDRGAQYGQDWHLETA